MFGLTSTYTCSIENLVNDEGDKLHVASLLDFKFSKKSMGLLQKSKLKKFCPTHF